MKVNKKNASDYSKAIGLLLYSNQALYLINEAIPLLQLTISSSVRVLTAEDFRRTEEEEGIGFA